MTAIENIKQRAAAGALWMDTRKPGWANKIIRLQFDIGHCRRCIAGQALADECRPTDFDGYEILEFELLWSTRVELGFTLSGDEQNFRKDLTAAWLAEVDKRLAAPEKYLPKT